MTERRKLPVGIENFRKLREEGFYYIDKSRFISDLLCNWAEVNLFTRPRRFGKTLNMDMLRQFLEIGGDQSLFEGLSIMEDKELCARYMGKFPVISISLKDVDADSFETAYDMLCSVVIEEADRLQWLLKSDRISQFDKEQLEEMIRGNFEKTADLYRSLKTLSRMLYRHYGKQVIILIDEYDVPLDKAYQFGYYDQMIALIRSMLKTVLKTNENLYFAVLTGCMRVSKESIFTGFNNFTVHSISDAAYDEYFGFTDLEVRRLLHDYGMSEKYDEVREWYDGYRFGKENIYCPWDVLSYVKDHLSDTDAEPKLYWANSSGNSIVRNLIDQATGTVKAEIEELIRGETVEKELAEEFTYKDLETENSEEKMKYLWSMLYTTGYLTDERRVARGLYRFRIPNREVRQIFEEHIQNWFSGMIRKESGVVSRFCDALENGDEKTVEECFNRFLRASISIRDTAVRKGRKEAFYHGVILGLLGSREEWIVKSNPESGDGYCDILVEIPSERTGCVIEVKYAEERRFDTACREALEQIRQKRYEEKLKLDGVEKIRVYGIACWRKECVVKSEMEQGEIGTGADQS